jgi:MFS transporter, FSR family, fosmidomycin resistance protein
MRGAASVLIILAVEFFDELVFGAREAAWPLIRDELKLSYTQIGALLSIPGIVANGVEPIIALAGDVWKRRNIIFVSGLIMAAATVLLATGRSYVAVLIAFLIMYPASGGFVSLSQAALMDLAPEKHEKNMARWSVAGAIGSLAGPLILSVFLLTGLTWRNLFLCMALGMIVLVITQWTKDRGSAPSGYSNMREGVAGVLSALRSGSILRRLALLEVSDLMLDVLFGFLALYFVDVAGSGPATAGVSVAVWTAGGLAGSLLLVRFVDKIGGTRYLRVSTVTAMALFPAFLLIPSIPIKLVLLGTLGVNNAGWYPILKAGLYTSLKGKAGTALVVSNVAGIPGALLPLLVGVAAEVFGLQAAIWGLLLAPVIIAVLLPGGNSTATE